MEHLSQGPLEGELVPFNVRPNTLPVAATAGADRDRLAFAWLMAKRTKSRNTAGRYRRDVTGWAVDSEDVPIPGPVREGPSFFYWTDQRGLDVFQMLPVHIDGFMHWLESAEHHNRYRDKTKLAASTRLGKLNAVRSFYRYCIANMATTLNPAALVDGPEVDNTKSKTIGLEAEQLLACQKTARAYGLREYALFMLLASTGLRVSEAMGADTGDLRREGASWFIYVVRKGYEDKTPVPVADPAARAIRRYVRYRRGPLFLDETGKRMTREAAGNRIRTIALRALGSPKKGGPRISPHSLRHTATTYLINQGEHMANIQALMNHRSAETTRRYDRADRARNNPAVAKMASLLEDGMADADTA